MILFYKINQPRAISLIFWKITFIFTIALGGLLGTQGPPRQGPLQCTLFLRLRALPLHLHFCAWVMVALLSLLYLM